MMHRLFIEEGIPMSPVHLSRFESAMRVVLEFSEAFNRHDIPEMMQRMSEDCILESASPAPDGSSYVGKEAITQFWQEYFHLFPQVHREIEEIFSMGNRSIMRWRSAWVDAAGCQQYIRGIDLFMIRDGFICQYFSYVKG